ncbi:hypothetical protein GCM10012275_13550 [Longimycelium tulufanense]|uniref:Toxin-antitoxin system HicB family antitoxin n=1 Tax=Longimycelium tulufanense TaxID=907463 RepID=A0A8J3C6T9_9PSEU|nr:hypothetical protein [Longimycelium tulufanense]GGM43810.1 hypothetical protein GCM10012275_13550 [Longimycelium tulufanense]
MTKRLTLLLPDGQHAEIKQSAEQAGMSLHAWILHAIERENLRQRLAEHNEWCLANKGRLPDPVEEYKRRAEAKKRALGGTA